MASVQRVGLFGTLTRSRVLLVVFLLKESHASELARVLGSSLSLVQKAVDSLERAGVLVGIEEGRTRRIQLNPAYPYLEALRELLNQMGMDDVEIQKRLAEQRRRPRRAGKDI